MTSIRLTRHEAKLRAPGPKDPPPDDETTMQLFGMKSFSGLGQFGREYADANQCGHFYGGNVGLP